VSFYPKRKTAGKDLLRLVGQNAILSYGKRKPQARAPAVMCILLDKHKACPYRSPSGGALNIVVESLEMACMFSSLLSNEILIGFYAM
jgi:hypothetical protein